MNTLAVSMAYLPTDQTSGMNWIVSVSLGAAVLSTIFIIVAGCLKEGKVANWFVGAASVCVAVAFSGAVASKATAAGDAEELSQSNKQNLIENINQVYDIDSVELPKGESISPRESRDIFVMVDGFAYKAILTQDEDTYEPNLVLISSPNVELPDIQKR